MKQMPRVLVALCVALAAALLAHVTIDVAGDHLLARDTYDALDHGSRGLVASGAFALVLVAIAAALRAAFLDARGSERAFCALLQRALPASQLQFVAETLALTFVLLLGMEALDVIVAGQPIDDVTDLLGGSLALGAAIALSCALCCAASAWEVLRRCAAASEALVAVFATFFRVAAQALEALLFAIPERSCRFACAAPALARRLAGRAPPSAAQQVR